LGVFLASSNEAIRPAFFLDFRIARFPVSREGVPASETLLEASLRFAVRKKLSPQDKKKKGSLSFAGFE